MAVKCKKSVIISVLIFSIIALILQLVGLVIKQWMYAPSVEEVVNGQNMTFYSIRGLWESGSVISKYSIAGEKEIIDDADEKYKSHTFLPADLDPWFDAVQSLLVIGAVVNLGSMISAVVWLVYLGKGNETLTDATQQLAFLSLLLAGILDLLGVTILIGKLDPNLTSWGGAFPGFAGTFCIMGAGFIRMLQQNEHMDRNPCLENC